MPRTVAGGVSLTEESERENDATMSPTVLELLRLVADSDGGARTKQKSGIISAFGFVKQQREEMMPSLAKKV